MVRNNRRIVNGKKGESERRNAGGSTLRRAQSRYTVKHQRSDVGSLFIKAERGFGAVAVFGELSHSHDRGMMLRMS